MAPKERVNEIGDYVRSRIGSGASTPPSVETPPPSETVVSSSAEQLKQLGELRDAGIVTPEEFEAKKAELLARM